MAIKPPRLGAPGPPSSPSRLRATSRHSRRRTASTVTGQRPPALAPGTEPARALGGCGNAASLVRRLDSPAACPHSHSLDGDLRRDIVTGACTLICLALAPPVADTCTAMHV